MQTTGRRLPQPLDDVWPAVPDAVTPIRHAVLGYARAAGARPGALDAIGLAVSEAATNAVLHAFVGRAPGHIFMSAQLVDAGTLRVTVADDGRGVRPHPASTGLGLGLALIAEVTQNMRVGRGTDGGTGVAMEFALARERPVSPGRPGPPPP